MLIHFKDIQGMHVLQSPSEHKIPGLFVTTKMSHGVCRGRTLFNAEFGQSRLPPLRFAQKEREKKKECLNEYSGIGQWTEVSILDNI